MHKAYSIAVVGVAIASVFSAAKPEAAELSDYTVKQLLEPRMEGDKESHQKALDCTSFRSGRGSKPKGVVEASIHGDGRWPKLALEIEGQVQHLRGEKTEEHARVDIIGPGGDLLQERRRELRKGRTGSHHG